MLACRKLSYHDKFHSARVEVPTRWEITRQVCSSLSSTPQNASRKLGGKVAWRHDHLSTGRSPSRKSRKARLVEIVLLLMTDTRTFSRLSCDMFLNMKRFRIHRIRFSCWAWQQVIILWKISRQVIPSEVHVESQAGVIDHEKGEIQW